MERVPKKAPLPCFGLEYDRYDKECRECPHSDDCILFMGSRAEKVPLSKVRFNILPENYREHTLAAYEIEDPELPYLQRLYCDCFASVYHRNTTENVTRYREMIAVNARKVPCSVRMFMLANMVAHEIGEAVIVGHTEKARATPFKGKLLTGDLSIKRAREYQGMCKDRYGTFSLKSLEILADDEKDPIDSAMLRSESTAAIWIVAYKIRNRAPKDEAYRALYLDTELQLDPEWLALEDSYVQLILKPFIDKKSGTPTLQNHRHNAFATHTRYKQRPSIGRNAWLARQEILPKALRSVLDHFGYRPEDFLYPRETITNAMEFWLELATAIRHNHCWKFLNGESSYFTPRRSSM